MKRSELTQLTHIIEHLVAKEVRKQLPSIIGETFKNMMGKSIIKEETYISDPVQEIEELKSDPKESSFKASLRELFSGTPVMKTPEKMQPDGTRQFKTYAKDPKINAILNETVSDLRDRDKLVGNAAFQGGYSSAFSSAPGFNTQPVGPGPMMDESEIPAFARNIPSIPSVMRSSPAPIISDNHVPMASIPEGLSALDFKNQAPPAVKNALTKNYSQMMKLIDKKKKNI